MWVSILHRFTHAQKINLHITEPGPAPGPVPGPAPGPAPGPPPRPRSRQKRDSTSTTTDGIEEKEEAALSGKI